MRRFTRSVDVSISGSYRKFREQLGQDIAQFTQLGVRVLSPSSADIIGMHKGFVSLRGDLISRIDTLSERRVPHAFRVVENGHLASVAASDFLWITTVDGYCGNSTAFEISYALSNGVSVYTLERNIALSREPLLTAYVTPVKSIAHAVAAHRGFRIPSGVAERMVVNPSVAVGAVVIDGSKELPLPEREVAVVRSKNWQGLYTIVGGRINEGENIPTMAHHFALKQTGTSGRVGNVVYAANMLPDSGYHDPHARRIYIDHVVHVREKRNYAGCEWMPLREAATSSLVEPNARASFLGCLERAA